MNDLRVGAIIRVARVRRGWRQRDVAAKAGVSQATVWRIERGHLDDLTVRMIRKVCAVLEVSLDLQPSGRGADLDRLANAKHTALHESVAKMLAADFPAWEVASEVSFSIFGERGIIDLLLWHPGRRALLIIELKTELVDAGDVIATMDIRRRLAREIVKARGWRPETVSTWVLLAASRTNERRRSSLHAMLRTAFPTNGRALRGFLRDPVGTVSGLSFWHPKGPEGSMAPVLRVDRRRRA